MASGLPRQSRLSGSVIRLVRELSKRLSDRALTGAKSFWFGQSARYYTILVIVTLLTGFGLIMVLSSSSIDSIKAGNNGFAIFFKQAFFAIVGLSSMMALSRLSFDRLRRLISWLFLGSIGLQVATVTFLGYSVNGNKNWINVFGVFNVQPSEIIKLTMILYLADYLAQREDQKDILRTWVNPFATCIVAIGSVLWGKDLGTAMVMVAILVGVLTFAGLPRVWFWRFTGGLALLGWWALNLGGSRMGRINAWLHHDWPDPMQYNWQQDHAVWAFASGGITGTGLGNSQLKWSWIPESENDFIFAIIGEEGGLLFALVIVALFVWLTYNLLFAYENNMDPFARYLLLGVMLWIGVQATINIAVVLGLLPVLGVPLPLMSAGGSSLIMLLSAVGLALGAERQFGTINLRRNR